MALSRSISTDLVDILANIDFVLFYDSIGTTFRLVLGYLGFGYSTSVGTNSVCLWNLLSIVLLGAKGSIFRCYFLLRLL